VAIVRASVWNRSTKLASFGAAASRHLTATVRLSTLSKARQTSPMPPLAMRSSSRYRPASTVPARINATPFKGHI